MRYNFSVAQLALEITDIKVERSKKRPDLLSKSQKNENSNFDCSYIQNHMHYREVIYLIGKPLFSAFWRSKDMGRGSSIKAPTPILMNSYEFHLNRPGCFVLKATPYVFKRPKS